jgi:hypothetical protein
MLAAARSSPTLDRATGEEELGPPHDRALLSPPLGDDGSLLMRKCASTNPSSIDFPLPPAGFRRWTAHRKVAVVLAVRTNALSRGDAYDRYMLSEEELSSWESAFDEDGIAGLQAKRPGI